MSDLVDLKAIQDQMMNLELKPKVRSHQTFSGLYQSVFKGKGADFSEVRPYSRGDDVRRIHWRASARSLEPQVRLDREEREIQVCFLVDQNDRFLWSSTHKSKRERCAEMVAALGTCAMRSGDATGLTLFKGPQQHALRPKRSGDQLWGMVDACCTWSNDLPETWGRQEAETSLQLALQQMLDQLRSKSLVVVLSSFEGTCWRDELLQLVHQHDVLPIYCCDPRELSLNGGGVMIFDDGVQQRMVDLGQESIREDFANGVQQRLGEKVEFFESLGCDLLIQSQPEQVLDDLHDYLSQRLHHGGWGGAS